MAFYKKHCIRCETLIEGDATVCPNCGSHSPFTDRCFTCGREISRSNKFCPGCGKSLYISCPVCQGITFQQDRCDVCGAGLMIICHNPRCGAHQFFDAVKCTACGKKMKEGK